MEKKNMTTVRLPYDIEEKLDAASQAQHRPKSEFVREALVQYFAQAEAEKSSWEVGEPYFGNYGSGDGNLSVDYKNRLKDKIRAKASSAAKNRPR
ncbi:MAG: ribbon-helix-helix domain-containing protein [Treponema sp.]|jgi:Arc/MetJ-type ribon-helix-helix transcriptional regulator|nr:ribbon-helix-helix domain-containing protein [Treponema sp.]